MRLLKIRYALLAFALFAVYMAVNTTPDAQQDTAAARAEAVYQMPEAMLVCGDAEAYGSWCDE